MKRRHFLKTSVGAGLAFGIFPIDALAQRRAGGKTMYDKIWDEHEVAHLGGLTSVLHVDRLLLADGGPELIHDLLARGGTIRNPQLVWTVIDHSVSTSPDRYTNRSLNRGDGWRAYVDYADEMKKLGIPSFGIDDPRHGIQHVVGPETGLTQPGMLMVAGDSHTCTHGALGCVSWGGREPAERADHRHRPARALAHAAHQHDRLARFLVRPQRALLPHIGTLGADSGNRCAVEYAGPVVRALSVEQRMTICNLAIEMGSATGMVAPDDKTFEFMATREFRPRAEYWDQALAYWRTVRPTPTPSSIVTRPSTCRAWNRR